MPSPELPRRGKHIVVTEASWQQLEDARAEKTRRLGRLVTMAEAVEDMLAELDKAREMDPA